ncbi:hypothetical protein J1614_001383 [Plenodomus biglobosus]|nr:hypothetical protein J1614_001383 [Plenodomus biglobosus]
MSEAQLTTTINALLSTLNCNNWADAVTAASNLKRRITTLFITSPEDKAIEHLWKKVRKTELCIRGLCRDDVKLAAMCRAVTRYREGYQTTQLWSWHEHQRGDVEGYGEMVGVVDSLEEYHNEVMMKFLESGLERLREFQQLAVLVGGLEVNR